ncbi:MAG: hypothetical protein HYT73_00530 [Candidatus Aenigmarchaeota archaeon]|nr:hypothetical protein [Candidatus Aenigmarchaeota archaeon]
MSKRFKSQDYFRYPRLGIKWRRPKGLQSKLRLKIGGAGKLVAVGYGTSRERRNTINGVRYAVVSNAEQLGQTDSRTVIISSATGSKKALEISEKAAGLGIKILNMKKVRKSRAILKKLRDKKTAPSKDAGKKEDAKKKEEALPEEEKPREKTKAPAEAKK